MPTKTKIEWTDYTSNPIRYRTADGRVVWACEKVSAGCQNCYAEALSRRYTHRRAGDWNAATMATLTPFLDEKEVRHLLHMTSLTLKRVFMGDMTDIFGEWVPDEMIERLFAVFALRPDVTFQVLTKRSSRMRTLLSDPSFQNRVATTAALRCGDIAPEMVVRFWPLLNVWLGVSAEDQPRADERVPDLLATPAAVRFVSAEPLLSEIDFCALPSLSGIGRYLDALSSAGAEHSDLPGRVDWVIVGGESGAGARPCDVAWIRLIVEQCREAQVPVFVKQLGSAPESSRLPVRDFADALEAAGAFIKHPKGGDPSEWADDLRLRQFPNQVEAR